MIYNILISDLIILLGIMLSISDCTKKLILNLYIPLPLENPNLVFNLNQMLKLGKTLLFLEF